ncbi:hypothetical protein G7046_g2268 [Stylonectria norvegica]|nr:hypothetical protein G7046_g2268 [Stylonectria norvegica]
MVSNQALEALGHAVSGSIGTAISTASLYPLDLVTTRLKAQRKLDRADKYDGALYSGLGADVGKSVVDSFLFFGFYNYLRRRDGKARILEELVVGAVAGACARALTTPVSNVVTRKQMSSGDETLGEMLATIRKQSGLLGLWSGYSATLVLTMNPSITFFVNRRLAARIIPALEEEDIPVAWMAFLIAASSKAAAAALTYPFQTGKTRLQMASDGSTANTVLADEKKLEEGKGPAKQQHMYKVLLRKLAQLYDQTIFGVILRIVREEGPRALYDGIRGELLKSFFSHGLTMLSKGVIHRLVIRLWFLLSPHLPKRRLQMK